MTDPYEIPFTSAQSIKELVGKTLVKKDGRSFEITSWVGQNYTITDPATGKQGEYPAMFILDQVKRGGFEVK